MKKNIAITGGIGSGKSTVLRILKNAGYPVYSCDEIYKEVIKQADYVEEVKHVFPGVVENGEINRQKLASEVFNDEDKRTALNAIAHPKIMQALKEKLQTSKEGFVFAEVPLLIEENYQKDFDAFIVILRPLSDRITSVCSRDGASEALVRSRIRTQYNYEETGAREKLEKAGAIILVNDGTEENLKNTLFSVLKNIP